MNVPRYYRPELDILRLIAFLCVFAAHRMDLGAIDPKEYFWAYQVSWVGVFGVPVFFLLSAFLITELLTRELDQTGSLHVKSFYFRRILRIWPLYFLVFFANVIGAHFFPAIGHLSFVACVAFTFFSANWYICANGWMLTYPAAPLWSISIEEQFYIMIPLLTAYAGRRGLKIAAYLFLAIAYLFIIYYGMHPTTGFSSEWTNSFVQFQFFSAGILLSLYLKGRLPKIPMGLRLVMIPLAIGCWLVAKMVCGIQADSPHLSNVFQEVSGWLLVLLGCLLLFFSLLGMPAKFLPKPFVHLGRISYGLYVFHAMMFWLVYHTFKAELAGFSSSLHLYAWRNSIGALIAFILTVIISMLSYRFFEKPFLRLKKRYTIVPSRD